MEFSYLYALLVPIVFFIAARRLLNGVYILLILLPVERFFVTKALGLNMKLPEWMGLVCVIVFMWNFLFRHKNRMFPAKIMLPLLTFILVNIFLLLINLPDLITIGKITDLNSAGFRSIKVVIWCIYSVLVAMAVSYSVKDKRDLKNIIGVYIAVALILCSLSLFSLIAYFLGARIMTWALIERHGFLGIKGCFSEPQYLSLYLSPIVPLALTVFVLRVYKLGIMLTILASFILLLSNYFSFSTTGLAGGTITLLILPFLIWRYRIVSLQKTVRYVVIILLCVYIIFLIGTFFDINFIQATTANYFDKIAGYKDETRYAGRVMALNMFKDSPILGRGPGNWAWHADQMYINQVEKHIYLRPSYNCLYWEILVDLGIIGFIPFLWFLISLFKELSKRILKAKDVFFKAILTGFVVGFISLLAEYYVTFNFYRIYVWVTFGIVIAAIRLAKEEEESG
ncbi:MAG: hypothetical protein COS99_02060 [Candidatus Omnitrophica bacterium CG07_land_8_20_14_0_80_42_15]|uniref:O-antigen ligase-related domain-containing protein n=1 Tax=Candidatus Aquitaenariimonas noxiae TaxID=1974741 RepID=A0A2J0KXQ5_9BACT|nr:MAG: hypothetical protein COS99_02060 [Candidatus Omnitrophica bacterium CG07_land_8_20_14_0_80_42_15]